MSQSDDFDYGTTIHLPQTDFPRRAGLAQLEPKILSRWNKMGFYQQQRETSKGREKFILHFGPPFANGHIHLGHLLSHTLKDFVCRSQQMLGRDAPLIPGYDCHGLPIEWKIEEKYRAEKKNTTKDSDPVSFRRECRDYAAHWSTVQTGELQRLGINGDWQNPYSTMHNKSEAKIASEIHKFLLNGSLYRGSKPVMWSTVEQTALAEAEVEYKDVMSDTVYVKFPIKSGGPEELRSASIVIWTTTPWTLPGNRAVAYGEDIEYVAIEITAIADEATARTGDKIVIAKALLESLQKVSGITAYKNFWSGTGRDLTGTVCHHCLAGKRYNFDVPVLPGDFVTTETGTGFVHVAPGHGEDDYHLGLAHKIEIPHTVQGDGTYFPDVPLFAGMMVYDSEKKYWPANKEVIKTLIETGALVAKNKISHSYPHSWRSKAPVIFRNTPQWFISMEKNDLRKKALSEIEKTRFVPAKGKNRIGSMVESRGDWCVSRQLWWGQRIPAYFYGEGEDDFVVAETMEEAVALATKKAGRAIAQNDLRQDPDVLDTWASSWLWPMEVFGGFQDKSFDRAKGKIIPQNNPDLNYFYPTQVLVTAPEILFFWVARMIIAGYEYMDKKPFEDVYLTGIVRDKLGRKMSKSLGNSPDPLNLIKQYGADGVRTGMLFSSPAGNDLLFDEKLCEQGRNFANKIWNAFRLVKGWEVADAPWPMENAIAVGWFEAKLNEGLHELADHFSKFRISDALMTTYKMVWDDFCSWYLEIIKPPFGNPIDRATYNSTISFFETLLKLLHPFMPFITEELWHELSAKEKEDCILTAAWPVAAPAHPGNKQVIEQGALAFEIISQIRNLRNAKGISPKVPIGLDIGKVLELVDGLDASSDDIRVECGLVVVLCHKQRQQPVAVVDRQRARPAPVPKDW